MKKAIENGVYLVIDPNMKIDELDLQLSKLQFSKLSAIQLWDNPLIRTPDRYGEVIALVNRYFDGSTVPFLINNRWELLLEHPLDGVHFDQIPPDMGDIMRQVARPFLKGVTLNNDLKPVEDAEKFGFDYLSFCSIFPSSTSNSCELVSFATIKACRKKTALPIFLAGGITPARMQELELLDFNGVAVVSGIMKAADPSEQVEVYSKYLKA